MQPLEMYGVYTVLLTLQPVARCARNRHVFEAARVVQIPVPQTWRGIGPQIRPQKASFLAHGVRSRPYLSAVAIGGPKGVLERLLDAHARFVEAPAVITATEAGVLNEAMEQVGSSMRTILVEETVGSPFVLVENEILAQQTDLLGRTVFQLGNRRHRMPVAPQQVAHRSAWSDLCQPLVVFCAEHRR